jgi:Ca2+/Na+ antiporter
MLMPGLNRKKWIPKNGVNKMKFDYDLFLKDRKLSYRYLKMLSIVVMLAATLLFIYFFITGNFHIHYIISIGCLWLLICGIFMWLISYLAESEKSIELTFEKTSNQVKSLGLLSLGAFYISGICFFAGLLFFVQTGDLWRNSIILFAGSILSLVICVYGLIQRKITKQHYELKKQQQEIIELLNQQNLKDIKDITGGALLA